MSKKRINIESGHIWNEPEVNLERFGLDEPLTESEDTNDDRDVTSYQ